MGRKVRAEDEAGGADQAGGSAKAGAAQPDTDKAGFDMGGEGGVDARRKLVKGLRHAAAKDDRLRAEDMDQADEPLAQKLCFVIDQALRQRIASCRSLKDRAGG